MITGCVGASIRNFGFITVTGQPAGDTWRRARASRDVWAEVAPQAGIAIEHRGLWLLARRPKAAAVLQAFMAHRDGRGQPALRCGRGGCARGGRCCKPTGLRGCDVLTARTCVSSRARRSRGSPPGLQKSTACRFLFGETVLEVQAPRVRTARRELRMPSAWSSVPGTELNGVGAAALAPHALKLCQIADDAGASRAGLFACGGGDERPQPGALWRLRGAARVGQRCWRSFRTRKAASLAAGIHLIVVQSADGTLVVGDSHHTFSTPEPFADEGVDRLILRHLRETLDLAQCEVVERWTGVYPDRRIDRLRDRSPPTPTPASSWSAAAPGPARRSVLRRRFIHGWR